MKVQVINTSTNKLPEYETKYAACADVRADFSSTDTTNPIKAYGDVEFFFNVDKNKQMIKLSPGSRAIIPTGLRTSIPRGYEIQVRMRSGLSIKTGLMMCNAIGVIDEDYTGNIGIILTNQGFEDVFIEHGERIAQLALCKVERIEWEEVYRLTTTERGDKGYGSTGSN